MCAIYIYLKFRLTTLFELRNFCWNILLKVLLLKDAAVRIIACPVFCTHEAAPVFHVVLIEKTRKNPKVIYLLVYLYPLVYFQLTVVFR